MGIIIIETQLAARRQQGCSHTAQLAAASVCSWGNPEHCKPTPPTCSPRPRPSHSHSPQNWGAPAFGPPYALISGAFETDDANWPLEGNPVISKGDVGMVPGSTTFVICLADHPEWGKSHTVWGTVRTLQWGWGSVRNLAWGPGSGGGRVSSAWGRRLVHVAACVLRAEGLCKPRSVADGHQCVPETEAAGLCAPASARPHLLTSPCIAAARWTPTTQTAGRRFRASLVSPSSIALPTASRRAGWSPRWWRP